MSCTRMATRGNTSIHYSSSSNLHRTEIRSRSSLYLQSPSLALVLSSETQTQVRCYSFLSSPSFLFPLTDVGPLTASTRSYTPLKIVGDGSFGTVWLCDWHGLLPPNTPLSPMQCGAGARPEWAGKRLVAVKRMKKRWDGGWEECRRLRELEASFITCYIQD